MASHPPLFERKNRNISLLCPCGTGNDYDNCCGLYIEQGLPAPTPESLMRSRYSAFVKKNIPYIASTMRGEAAKDFKLDGLAAWLETVSWLNLQVITSETPLENKGYVSFVASYETPTQKLRLAEKSEFHKIAQRWYYVKGTHPMRNEPCLCLSGKKYKNCCGRSE